MLACGVDVGTVQTKAVIVDGNRTVQGRGLVLSGANLARAARHALREALLEAEIAEYDVTYVMATGYGRHAVNFAHSCSTEPVCHAIGAVFRYPATRTVLDIGGQEMTAIKVDSEGKVLDFVMNDKCAAGTGRFIEAVAELLGMTLEEISETDIDDNSAAELTSVCSVLAETEITSFLEQGKPVSAILAGVFMGLANRAANLLSRIGAESEVTLTGGVSQNQAMVKSLERALGQKMNAGVDGVFIGALGAAILGLEKATNGRSW